MEQDLIQQIAAIAEAFGRARRLKQSTVSQQLAGDWRWLGQILSGKTSFTIRKFDDFLAKASANWPDDAEWPEGVTRPEPVASPQQEQNP